MPPQGKAPPKEGGVYKDPVTHERKLWTGQQWMTLKNPSEGIPSTGTDANDSELVRQLLTTVGTIGGGLVGGPPGAIAGGAAGRALWNLPNAGQEKGSFGEDVGLGAMEGGAQEMSTYALGPVLKYGGKSLKWLGNQLPDSLYLRSLMGHGAAGPVGGMAAAASKPVIEGIGGRLESAGAGMEGKPLSTNIREALNMRSIRKAGEKQVERFKPNVSGYEAPTGPPAPHEPMPQSTASMVEPHKPNISGYEPPPGASAIDEEGHLFNEPGQFDEMPQSISSMVDRYMPNQGGAASATPTGGMRLDNALEGLGRREAAPVAASAEDEVAEAIRKIKEAGNRKYPGRAPESDASYELRNGHKRGEYASNAPIETPPVEAPPVEAPVEAPPVEPAIEPAIEPATDTEMPQSLQSLWGPETRVLDPKTNKMIRLQGGPSAADRAGENPFTKPPPGGWDSYPTPGSNPILDPTTRTSTWLEELQNAKDPVDTEFLRNGLQQRTEKRLLDALRGIKTKP